MQKLPIITAMICLFVSAGHAQTVAQPQASQAVAPQTDLALQLICRGTGERKVRTHGSGFAFGSNGQSAWGVGSGQQVSQFGDQMDFEISGGRARARVPRRFLPPMHGGDGGWFDVQELVVSDTDITGKVAINFANHPNLRLDRRAGTVALDGKVGSFTGECQKVDPNQRAF